MPENVQTLSPEKLRELSAIDPFNPDVLFAQSYNLLKYIVDTRNAANLRRYLSRYKQIAYNWRVQRVKFPLPAPETAWEVEADFEQRRIIYFGESRTGQLVTEPLPAPWDIPEPKPPDNNVYFGPAVDGWPGAFYATHETTVPPGTKATHNKTGKKYVLIEIGKPGSIIYRKLWAPVEDVEE